MRNKVTVSNTTSLARNEQHFCTTLCVLGLGKPVAQKEHSMQIMDPLTKREYEVLALVAQGFTNRQIATALFISENTVQNHLRSIFDKLGVTSRIQAVLRVNMLVYTDR